MLVVETIAKIRRAYFVQGKALKAISRELKISRGYGQSWCTGSSGGFFLGILNGLAIAKLDAFDQLAQAIRAVELAPVTLGRLG